MAIFLTVLPRALFRTQLKVYDRAFFCKNSYQIVTVNFFPQKSPAINAQLCSKNASVVCKVKRNKLFYIILHNFI